LVKADAYFALTPSVLMGGGHLAVDWRSGDLHAWLNAGVDFLMNWEPYHYDGRIYVSVGASWKIFSVQLSADLHLWGPEFSGRAHVSWFIISFDIAFGNVAAQEPVAIVWEKFKKAFLPKNEDVLTASVIGGKVTQHGSQKKESTKEASKDLGTINPRELAIAVHSAIPIKYQQQDNWLGMGTANEAVGIAPMDRKPEEWTSSLTVTIRRSVTNVNGEFKTTPVLRNVPSALWGSSMKAKDRASDLIEGALVGYEIRPSREFEAATPSVDPFAAIRAGVTVNPTKSVEADGVEKHEHDVHLESVTYFDAQKDEDSVDKIKETVHDPQRRAKREAVLAGFDLDTKVDWSGMTASAWHGAPRMVAETVN
jgi:hypothetical protein